MPDEKPPEPERKPFRLDAASGGKPGAPRRRPFGWSWRWNSPPFVMARLFVYLLLIGFILFYRPASKDPSRGPEGGGPPPTERAPEVEIPLNPKDGLPQTLLYGWGVQDQGPAGQRVLVLLRFIRNFELLKWEELELRGPGKDATVLATAGAPAGQPQPAAGLTLITFQVAAPAPVFTRGRLSCWGHDLCPLPSDRLTPVDALEQALRDSAKEAAAKAADTPPPPADGRKEDAMRGAAEDAGRSAAPAPPPSPPPGKN